MDAKINNDLVTLAARTKGGLARKVAGPWLEISFKDTGVGISKDHLGRVFEPFFTTKEIGKGTGLGLAVSMGIVQKHNGDLRVDSAGANRGSTFYLILPVKSTGLARGIERRTGLAA